MGTLVVACGLLSACGGGGGSDAVQANPQSLSLAAPMSSIGLGSTMVAASASSGLAPSYTSTTPTVCTVNASTGEVTGLTVGTCTLRITQRGDTRYAPAEPLLLSLTVSTNPAQTIGFGAAPSLSVGGLATVEATASSGLAVSYASLSPTVCSVNASSGRVEGLSAGTCTISANQMGNAFYLTAAQVTQDLPVMAPITPTVPGAPTGVRVQLGDDGLSVTVNAQGVDSGGRALSNFTVRSVPEGAITSGSATGSSLPLTVNCPGGCAGHAFTLSASNNLGEGAASTATDIITHYTVVTTFHEPDTQPRDSIFIGRFTANATQGTVTGLRGELSESMTGSPSSTEPSYGMTWLSLTHQLDARAAPGGDGLLVTTFQNPSTLTFTTLFGGDGWSPEAGVAAGGVYAGFPNAASNPGNAYVRIFVNPANPTATLTPAQIDTLAYADCAPGGMMGAVCMTGTSVAGYGAAGTMSGYPVSQVISRVP